MPTAPEQAAPGPGSQVPLPSLPPTPGEQAELIATGEKEGILGFSCARYELRQRGDVMEIWATDLLLPFQPYAQDQPHRAGPHATEELWGRLLQEKKLFPLLVILRFEAPVVPGEAIRRPPGPERMRFEVKAVKPEKIQDNDGTLFQPPPGYHPTAQLPF